VGIENGLSGGRALKNLVGRRKSGFVSLLASLALASCSSSTSPSPAPSASARLQSIPAGDPAKLPGAKETRNWGNPYIVIRCDRVGLVVNTAPNEERILKPEELLDVLAELPASAWPYGRVVAILVEEKSAESEQNKIELRRSRGIVAGELEGAHVAIHWVPAS